jgi:hypothetical protein
MYIQFDSKMDKQFYKDYILLQKMSMCLTKCYNFSQFLNIFHK